MARRKQTKAILVLGMHRSGTSAVTRVINLLGADLPSNLMQPSPENKKGYWEPMDIVLIHEQMLSSFGARWDDIIASNAVLAESKEIQQLRSQVLAILQRDFSESHLFVLKDPRICHLIPFWLSVLEEFGAKPHIVVPIRNPIEVAQSLRYRDGIIPAKSYLMWLQHVLNVEKHTQGYKRSFISFDALLQDWRVVARQMGQQLGIRWPRAPKYAAKEIEAFLSVQDRHHLSSMGALKKSAETPDWLKDAYTQALTACAGKEASVKIFNSIRNSMAVAGVVYDPIIEQLSQEAQALTATLAARDAEVVDRDQTIVRLTAEVGQRIEEAQALTVTLAARDAEVVDCDRTISYMKEEIDRLHRGNAVQAAALVARDVELKERETEIRLITDKITEREGELRIVSTTLHRIEESMIWRATYPIRGLGTRIKSLLRSIKRRRVAFRLIEPTCLHESEPGKWETTGNDPSFLLIPESGRFPNAGWARVNIEIDTGELKSLYPSFYLDCGSGFCEAERYPLPVPEQGRIDYIFRLPDNICALRFDPSEYEVKFTAGVFFIQEIGKVEAGVRILLSILAKRSDRTGLNIRRLYSLWRRDGMAGIFTTLFTAYKRKIGFQPADHYDDWVMMFDSLNDNDRKAIKTRIDGFVNRPLISVVMPVYNTPARYLQAAIESVRAQLYPFWELCIADDASTEEHVQKILSDWQRKDKRINVVFRQKNGHISAASNSALSLATGEYIALFDHDDVLPEHALYMVVEELNRHPDTDLLYSDEDKIDTEGKRFDPYFKSDWNPELILGQNMFCHLGVYRRNLVQTLGGFRVGFEGSQDYDLILRASECTPMKCIRHIPHILYHWRAIPGSAAAGVHEKSYTSSAAYRALREHLERRGIHAQISPSPSGVYHRVSYELPEPAPRVSLIVPTRDMFGHLRTCVEGLLQKTDYPDLELIIVDNQSREQQTLRYLQALKANSRVRVLRYDAAFNYSAINNFAAHEATGDILGLINNDIEVIEPGWLKAMVSHAARPDTGVVGALLYYPDDSIQHAGVIMGIGGTAGHWHLRAPKGSPGYFGRAELAQNLSAVTAACLIVRKDIFVKLGGLEEEHLKIAFNDVDFCLRVQEAGYLNVWTPTAELYHHESVSRGSDIAPDKVDRFRRECDYMNKRWAGVIAADPYYNPQLTLERADCVPAFPPRTRRPWIH